MSLADQEIFKGILDSAGDRLSRLNSDKFGHLKDKLMAWEREVRVQSHPLGEHPDAYYDEAWSVTQDVSPFSRSRNKTRFKVFVIAVKRNRHQILQFSFDSSLDELRYKRTSKYIASRIEEHKARPDHDRQMMYFGEVPINMSVPIVLEREYRNAFRRFEGFVDSQLRPFIKLRSIKPGPLVEAQSLLKSVLEQNLLVYRGVIEDHADLTALRYAEEIVQDKLIAKSIKSFGVYNHLIQTQATCPNARDYRYSALRQFAPLGDLFVHLPIWDKIDEGQSPIKVLAGHLGVQPHTLKHMAKRDDVFKLGQETKDIAQFLDGVDIQFWPRSKEDLQAMNHVIRAAKSYATAFSRDPAQVLQFWVREHKGAAAQSWYHVAHQVLNEHVSYLLEDPYVRLRHKNVLSKYNRPYLLNIVPEFVRERLEAIPEPFQKNTPFWNTVVETFEKSISNIRDMKADVERRILKPALLMEFEKQGFKIAEPSVMGRMIDNLRQSFWRDMSPSDQISASSYWHSPAVDISRRFNAVALAEGYSEWPCLVPDYHALKNGVVVRPLTSNVALRAESDAMSHCIWSYGPYFYTYNYHMMSLTDSDGKRLSSLTLKDSFDGNAGRRVQFSQNKSYKDAEPPAKAKEAAELLIDEINKGVVKPDWVAIDKARAEYKIKQIENDAGYDFRDLVQRQKVYGVYTPCIPKALRSSDGNFFESLSVKLRISDAVGGFIRDFDFSNGGIFKIENPNAQSEPRFMGPQPNMM